MGRVCGEGRGVCVAKLSSSANTFGFQSCAVFPWPSTTHLFHVTILNFLQKVEKGKNRFAPHNSKSGKVIDHGFIRP